MFPFLGPRFICVYNRNAAVVEASRAQPSLEQASGRTTAPSLDSSCDSPSSLPSLLRLPPASAHEGVLPPTIYRPTEAAFLFAFCCSPSTLNPRLFSLVSAFLSFALQQQASRGQL